MPELTINQEKILNILLQKSQIQSSEVYQELISSNIDVSLVTVKRELAELLSWGFVIQSGGGRYINYSISTPGRIFANIDARGYFFLDPDNRYGLASYNFELFANFPLTIFSAQENTIFQEATTSFIQKGKNLSPLLGKKELERLVIELSWKSSKIEGNTYSLLDTENLLRNHQEAKGHSKAEAQMILNHKEAFNYIWENKEFYKKLSRKVVEQLHAILVKDLEVGVGYRHSGVGVTGSKYQPLDNIYQIEEAMVALYGLVNKVENPFDKALITLAGSAYIQPFEDGNKRTSRLLTNAILLAHGMAPLSYRSVDEEQYRASMLAFYELNSLMPLKQIFKEQYLAATANYTLSS